MVEVLGTTLMVLAQMGILGFFAGAAHGIALRRYEHKNRTWRNWVPPKNYRDRWVTVVVCPDCEYVRGLAEADREEIYKIHEPKGAPTIADPCPRCGSYKEGAGIREDTRVNRSYSFTRARWRPTRSRYSSFLPPQGKWQLYPKDELGRLALIAGEDDE